MTKRFFWIGCLVRHASFNSNLIIHIAAVKDIFYIHYAFWRLLVASKIVHIALFVLISKSFNVSSSDFFPNGTKADLLEVRKRKC